MLAKKIHHPQEWPTRPINPRPKPLFDTVTPRRAPLALVREPQINPRGLIWSQRQAARAGFDPDALHRMLELEKLNLG